MLKLTLRKTRKKNPRTLDKESAAGSDVPVDDTMRRAGMFVRTGSIIVSREENPNGVATNDGPEPRQLSPEDAQRKTTARVSTNM